MTDTNVIPKIYFPVLALALLSSLCVFAFNLAHFGLSADAFVWTIRVVVKQGFIFFALSYIASPLYRWRPGAVSGFLMRHRATTGAAFAVTHLSVLLYVGYIWFHYRYIIEAISSPVERVLGLIVFAWIFLLLITSNQYSINKLGRKAWGGIHKYGMIVIWITYALDYTDRTVRWSYFYSVFLLVLLSILVLRIMAMRKPATVVATS